MSVLADTYGYEVSAYVRVDEGGEPTAGIPFSQVTDIIGEDIITLPFSDYCDPLVGDPEQWEQLVEMLLAAHCPITIRCLHNDILLTDERFAQVKKAKWHGIDLAREIDDIWSGFSGSARRAIKKAQNEGVTVQVAQDKGGMRAFYDMHLTVRKYKYGYLPQPYCFFENIWDRFIGRGNGAVMLALHAGKVIGGAVFLIWNGTLVYKFNASLPDYQESRPNDLIIWEGIKYGKACGCTAFDFGLSDWDQDGLLQFKRKFATEEKTISFLHHQPDGTTSHNKTALREVLGQITGLFTDESVPDSITERAGETLYRFFR
jgi:hypothetical protein